jgi:hypothetical protein
VARGRYWLLAYALVGLRGDIGSITASSIWFGPVFRSSFAYAVQVVTGTWSRAHGTATACRGHVPAGLCDRRPRRTKSRRIAERLGATGSSATGRARTA